VVTRTRTISGDADIYAERYDANLNPVPNPNNPSGPPAFRLNATTLGGQTTSRLVMDDKGDFVVTWNTPSSVNGGVSTVVGRAFDSQDNPQTTKDFAIGVDNGANRTNAGLALAPDGG